MPVSEDSVMTPTDAAAAGSPLGRSIPRREGAAKLRGQAVFVDDLSKRGVWFGGTVRSDVPHAKLLKIQFDPAFDWDQVVVVTADDIPGENVVPVLLRDQPSLASDIVRYVGEPVVLIAAPDRETLQQAIDGVTLETEPLEPTFEIDDSLACRATIYGTDNLFRTIHVSKGDTAAAMSNSDVVVTGEYRTGAQEHVYFEPQSMQAEPGPDSMTIRGSMQCPFYLVEGVATVLDLPEDNVRVIPCETGGGFGGKEDVPTMIAGHAALLASKARRPVRLIYDRVEDMLFTSKRHPSRIRHRSGWSWDGRLMAMQIDVDLDGGAYSTMSPLVLQRAAVQAGGPYRCDAIQIEARAVATNHPPRGAFRGFGGPQAAFALEAHLDRCADELGIDPVELRRRNIIRPGESLATGQIVGEDTAVDEVLERALAESQWNTCREQFAAFNAQAEQESGAARFRRRGIGLSLTMHGTGLNGNAEEFFASEVLLRGNSDGTISVVTGQMEIGQGTFTTLTQLAAEGLGLPVKWVVVEQPDTSRVPNSGPTVASRTMAVVGSLLITAGRQLRRKVEQHAGGEITDAAALRSAIIDFVADHPLEERVIYEPPSDLNWDENTHRGDVYFAFTWCCCVVALEVDTLTGEVTVLDVTAVQDVGRLVHPIFAAGQVEGAVAQGLGWALLETTEWSRGSLQNGNMTDYAIPSALDVPPIRSVFLEHPHHRSPHGARGLGEAPLAGPAPAVANALRQAMQIECPQIPIRPEWILPAWEEH
ncbi:MAG: xanthine dehydrogenase family protein molybdopterin-binding subunit [Planctomycetota bacterium]|jgi:CO/xanthine dehydrogenase Mo-binding subunit